MQFLGLCWRDIGRNRRRSVLTGLVMGFSVMAMMAVIALNEGSHRQLIESATDTLLGHAQIQREGFREQPDLEHHLTPAELAVLAPEVQAAEDVKAWAPRLVTGGLVSRKAHEAPGADDDGAAEGDAGGSVEDSAAAEGAFVLGVEPARERQVSRLAASVLPDRPRARCLRACGAALGLAKAAGDARCEAACREAEPGFEGAACATAGTRLCGERATGSGPRADEGEDATARCRATFLEYCEPARFLADATPLPDQPWLGEAVLGSGLAAMLGVDVGDRVALTTGTATGRPFATLYRVTGVLHSGSVELNRTTLLTHLDKLAAGLDLPGAASVLVLAVHYPAAAPEVAAALDRRVTSLTPGLRAWSWRELSPELYIVILLDSVSLYVTLILMFTVIGVILINIVTMSVLERTREYGVRLALGESPRRILWGLVTETCLLCLASAAVGVVLGEGLTWLMHTRGIDLGVDQVQVAGVLGQAVIYGDFTLLAPVFSVATVLGFSLLGSLYPAWRIHRLRPVDALRFS